jgi:hypothetical protein
MNGQYSFYRFQLNQDTSFHQQVGTVAHVENLSVVPNLDGNLRLDPQTSLAKLPNQSCFISALQESRSQSGMYSHGGIYHDPAHLIDLHSSAPAASSALSYLVRPPSTFNFSPAAACAAASLAVSTRNGEQET